MMLGDSKTIEADNSWVAATNTGLSSESGFNLKRYVYAIGGIKAAELASLTPTALLAAPLRNYRYALLNIGANDLGSGTTEATYKAAVTDILDRVHAFDPNVIVYVVKPWRRNVDAGADAMAGWIDDIVASRSSFAKVGHDERGWAKGSDNGATMFPDGVHPGPAGQIEETAQWLAVIP